MDNFREVHFHENGSSRRKKYDGSKGHSEEVGHFVNVILGDEKPSLLFDSLYETTLTTLKAMESLQKGKPFAL